jgi:hypothetical protein
MSVGDEHMNTFVAGVSIPASGGRGDVTFSGGYLTADCDGCSGHFVAGFAAERGLFRRQLDEGGTQFGLGINGSLGFAKPQGGSLWSVALGTPVYVGLGKPGRTQIVPFVIPALGWGLVLPDEGDSESGVRFTAGGGVGIVNVAPGLNLHLGAQKTFIQGGKTVFGGGLTYMIPR